MLGINNNGIHFMKPVTLPGTPEGPQNFFFLKSDTSIAFNKMMISNNVGSFRYHHCQMVFNQTGERTCFTLYLILKSLTFLSCI